MTPEEKAKFLVNDCYYQPFHLTAHNNALWEYAKNCAIICVDEIMKTLRFWSDRGVSPELQFWESVKKEIKKL